MYNSAIIKNAIHNKILIIILCVGIIITCIWDFTNNDKSISGRIFIVTLVLICMIGLALAIFELQEIYYTPFTWLNKKRGL